ncbi:Transcriptional regulatory protein ros [Brevundimonas sp. NIBR10]|uniref:MucR family transcriptional regulator n=1 Tax=Brevundimonas sp. NIBR10 TaxID=3015997 RepID=UPI0022F1988E|nr:MucR family transcriptional regulator [Brevundimonas sp. NIBR10]WGM46817.1 Transcriptional regulatory protein ros [Brevundimonas sp. NIBR10]
MADETYDTSNDIFSATIELASSYASNANNRLSPDDFQALIKDTFATLKGLDDGAPAPVEETEDLTKTKAEIKKSIQPDMLISFVDGKSYKSLKRHLARHGYTPESYRNTFGLGKDYPMVSPSYSAARSALAKSMGLGVGGRKPKGPAKKPRATKAPAAE